MVMLCAGTVDIIMMCIRIHDMLHGFINETLVLKNYIQIRRNDGKFIGIHLLVPNGLTAIKCIVCPPLCLFL